MIQSLHGYEGLRIPARRFGPFPYGENSLGEPLVIIHDSPNAGTRWGLVSEEDPARQHTLGYRIAKLWAFCASRERLDLWQRTLAAIAAKAKP